jgi:hypothetical protein
MHLALRDVEIDAVEGDDLAERLADPARADGAPDVRRAVALLRGCLETGQFVSGLGMKAPGTSAGAKIFESPG